MNSEGCESEEAEMLQSSCNQLDNSLAGQSDAGDEGRLQIVMDEPGMTDSDDLTQPDEDVEVT